MLLYVVSNPTLSMKYILLLLLSFFSFLGNSQNFEDTWEGLFSYVSVKAISEGNDKMYVASENSIFTYDLTDQTVTTISTIQGLSGEDISAIHYSEDFGLLLVGYENGLMDIIIDGEENILVVVDILEKPTIPPDSKGINDFYEYEGRVYISTQFGVSVYDLDRLEFGDTYFIGTQGAQVNITQTTVLPPYIYAASDVQGVKRALVEADDLIDFQNWNDIGGGNVRGVQTLGGKVYIARAFNQVSEYVEGSGFQFLMNFNTSIQDFEVHDGILAVTTREGMFAYGPDFSLLSSVGAVPEFEYASQSGFVYNNNFFIGTINLGMLIVPFGTSQATQVLPEGPILNNPFSIDIKEEKLWVVFGDVSVGFNPFPRSRFGISNLSEGVWTNIPYDELPQDATDIVNVTINPFNTNEVYMNSFIGGLLKVVDQVPVELFNEDNGNTNGTLIIPFGDPAFGIRTFGSDFDRDGNLWFVYSKSNDGLVRLSPSGQFADIDISDIIDAPNEQAFTELKISREGFVFFGTSESGLIGYDPSSGTFNKIDEGAGNGNLSNRNVRALEFDNQNRLWIGTLNGLRVLFNTGGFFEDIGNVEAQAIIIEEDGVGQELLFQQSITDIEVDGSNNKWIATATSGVFYLSPNGQETLLRFTTDNSPLPTNNVQDITVDEVSGTVYFATSNGLVAFKGTSTAPQETLENVYAFPNPVRPGFNGNVTIDGLTARANVKITDIEGNLVFETTSQGGSVQWDTRAFGKYKVASGVYLVLISTDDALETKIHKLMVVR